MSNSDVKAWGAVGPVTSIVPASESCGYDFEGINRNENYSVIMYFRVKLVILTNVPGLS
jgi:hypothetical protein